MEVEIDEEREEEASESLSVVEESPLMLREKFPRIEGFRTICLWVGSMHV